MAYDKQTWTETTPVSPGRLQHIEDGLGDVEATYATVAALGAQINVKDHGAVGNGVADDSAAIKAAAAAVTNGKTLYFPPGNYRFAEQSPTLGGAVVISGKSDVAIYFDPAARLTLDNLNGSGVGTSHGIVIKGAATNVAIINPSVGWAIPPSARSMGDGIRAMGYPSDSAPASGWTGSTGTIRNLTIVNARVVNAPQTGAVLHGVTDVKVSGFRAIGTKADGLHFNACRRINVSDHSALDCGDDGLAFVTYQHDTDVWDSPSGGPFSTATLSDWCNTGAASGVVVADGVASGVRVQQARDLSISAVVVQSKPNGIIINSSISGGGIDWTSLASNGVSINGVSLANCTDGVTVKTEQINSTDDEKWWLFTGVVLSNVTGRGCTNWSLTIEGDGSADSIVAGISLGYMRFVAGSGGGGNGGINITSLRRSSIDQLRLISDHAAAFTIGGADAIRSGSVAALPSSDLTIGQVSNDGGRLLIQDMAGMSAGIVESRNATGDGVQLHRVGNSSVQTLRAHLPGRGLGLTRGILLTKSFNVDVAACDVVMDTASPSSFSCLEVGGGNADDIAANGLRVEKVTYTSQRDDTAHHVGAQGGTYQPVGWYARTYWRHSGATSPVWSSTRLGDITPP